MVWQHGTAAWQHGSMAWQHGIVARQHGNMACQYCMATQQRGSTCGSSAAARTSQTAAWQHGSMAAEQHDSTAAWQQNSMIARQHGTDLHEEAGDPDGPPQLVTHSKPKHHKGMGLAWRRL